LGAGNPAVTIAASIALPALLLILFYLLFLR
jgi:hypothetical protein